MIRIHDWMAVILGTLAAAAAVDMLWAGGPAAPLQLRWPLVAIVGALLGIIWLEGRALAGPSRLRLRTHRHVWMALTIVAVLVLETEAGFFTALAAGGAAGLEPLTGHVSVRGLAAAAIGVVAVAVVCTLAALRRRGDFSVLDVVVAAYLVFAVSVMLVARARGAALAEAFGTFTYFVAGALVYLPARYFIRAPRGARVAGIVVLCAGLLPLAAFAWMVVFTPRSAVLAPARAGAPPRWMPEGWTFQEDASISKGATGLTATAHAIRLQAGATSADFRFDIPDWFVVPGRPIVAEALLHGENATQVDLQLFQPDLSVHSLPYRNTGEWATLVVEGPAADSPAPMGLDVNLSPHAGITIESVKIIGPRGTLWALGRDRPQWEPAGWTLLSEAARLDRISNGKTEQVGVTSAGGAVDWRYVVQPEGIPAGSRVTVAAQVYATRPITALQLVAAETTLETVRHRGSGWETLVATVDRPEGQLTIDLDLDDGWIDVQSVTLRAGGRALTLLGTVREPADLQAEGERASRDAVPAHLEPLRAATYRERLVTASTRAGPAAPLMLVALALAAIWVPLRRQRSGGSGFDRALAGALLLFVVAAIAAVAYVPTLFHPGYALPVFIAMAVSHIIPARDYT